MPRVTITVPDRTPQPYRFQLDRRVVSLGRGSENDIPIDSGSVSVKHAEMVRIHGGYELRDLGSTNGTKLNDERKLIIPLVSGTSAKLGDVVFDFVLSEEELEALAAEGQPQPVGLPPLQGEPAIEPREAPMPRPVQPYAASASSGGMGLFMLVLLLVLGIFAFFVGAELRHRKETGRSLLDDIKGAKAAKQVPAAPAAPEAPAEEAKSGEAPANPQ